MKMNTLSISIGNFLFRYRTAISPVVLLVALVVSSLSIPDAGHSTSWLFYTAGILIAGLGQLVRFITIGYEYIERGGKNYRVHASSLVQSGIFSLCRNPMYVGNILIALGIVIVANTLPFYLLVLPFVILEYICIVSAEENFLRNKFNREYTDYCDRVNRWVPAIQNWQEATSGMRFNWKRVISKEYNTTFMLGATLGIIIVWHQYYMDIDPTPLSKTFIAVVTGIWILFYIAAKTAKKTGALKTKRPAHGIDTAS